MEPFSLPAALEVPGEETHQQTNEHARTVEERTECFVPSAAMDGARERAIEFLVSRGIEERRAADGHNVGIQATISTSVDGKHAIDLSKIVDGMVEESQRSAALVANDASRVPWQVIADEVQARLGFPLEPELFSNMLFVAYVGVVDHSAVRSIAKALLSTFVRSDVRGLYHFFTSLRFACDIDCTAVAAKARLLIGELDPSTKRGATQLRTINDRILRSAAVQGSVKAIAWPAARFGNPGYAASAPHYAWPLAMALAVFESNDPDWMGSVVRGADAQLLRELRTRAFDETQHTCFFASTDVDAGTGDFVAVMGLDSMDSFWPEVTAAFYLPL